MVVSGFDVLLKCLSGITSNEPTPGPVLSCKRIFFPKNAQLHCPRRFAV